MFGSPVFLSRRSKDEAEKPFWISFADLMTSLMVLFLVVMVVALVEVTNGPVKAEQENKERGNDISMMLDGLEQCSATFPGVQIRRERNAIDFGDRARFESGSHRLSIDQAQLLRRFVPCVLDMAKQIPDKGWLKRVVVEGFADNRGTYLFNLDLSLKRSQRVLCVLLEPQFDEAVQLTAEQKARVRELFLVGGYSFNSARESLEESRRIELRLEFYEVGEVQRPPTPTSLSDLGLCALGGGV
jgi:outer membrane protein OmpA-like peptidoglycan-associated protein